MRETERYLFLKGRYAESAKLGEVDCEAAT